MPFCVNCGIAYQEGMKFCGNCGSKTGEDTKNQIASSSSRLESSSHAEITLWEGKPNGLTDRVKDKAKINSTEYTITNQRIIVKSGLIGKKHEEIELIRVKDISVKQSISDRLLGVGTITILSLDRSTPTLTLEDIKDSSAVKDIIRQAVRDEKSKLNISYRENL